MEAAPKLDFPPRKEVNWSSTANGLSSVVSMPPQLSGINVIVPMAGQSGDFAKAGYRFPKPLVSIVGRPLLCWMLDWLKLHPDDTVFLAMPQEMEREHAIERRLRDEYPSLDIRLVLLDFDTRGPAETLFAVLQHMSSQELERRTISLDCDTVFFTDLLTQFRTLPPGVSGTWYFEDQDTQALYSYLKLVSGSPSGTHPTGEGANLMFVKEVREKLAISRNANVGAYGFESGALLKLHCEAIVDTGYPLPGGGSSSFPSSPAACVATPGSPAIQACSPSKAVEHTAGSWYISAVMRSMLQHGVLIAGLPLKTQTDFISLGTPAQMREFLGRLQAGDARLYGNRRMRFVFGLDGTLVTPPKSFGDWGSVEPIEQNVALVRSLKAAGHYVIIWTSRESERLKGNLGQIVAAIGKVTMETLEKLQIPHDELLFGKPHADAYIDERAVNSRVDTEKELGWLANNASSDAPNAGLAGSVAARAFNNVRPLDERHVAKSGPVHVMRGELYWYRHIPPALTDLFPTPVEMSDTGTHLASIVMTKVDGVPFTHLLCNLCLTPARLVRMLNAMTRIHQCNAQGVDQPFAVLGKDMDPADDISSVPDSMLYVNLRPKLAERIVKYRSLYRSFSVSEVGFNTEELGQKLVDALQHYESEGRACRADYIHGDTVFSNVLLNRDGGDVCFLDMRGALGDRLTTAGDVTYDLAKVFQSLCGYDFFLQDREVSPAAQRHLDLLQRVFWSHVTNKYPSVSAADVRLVTASHFFSLIPLHEVRARMRLCLRMANALTLQGGLVKVGSQCGIVVGQSSTGASA